MLGLAVYEIRMVGPMGSGFDAPVPGGGHIGVIPGMLVEVVGNPTGDLVASLDRQFFSFAKC